MKSDFIESIQSRGYWRINLRPTQAVANELALSAARQIVEHASVSLRGWDYPHIPHREGDDTGLEQHGNFVQAWTDWSGHREFWRMYRSGQFLHYRALNEDWSELDNFGSPAGRSWGSRFSGPVLGVVNNLWLITEVFEFVSRLVDQQPQLYGDGVQVNLTLTSGDEARSLWIEEAGRMPFSYDRVTSAVKIDYAVTLSAEDASSPKIQAELASRYFFDSFGWDPSHEQLMLDIEKLYKL